MLILKSVSALHFRPFNTNKLAIFSMVTQYAGHHRTDWHWMVWCKLSEFKLNRLPGHIIDWLGHLTQKIGDVRYSDHNLSFCSTIVNISLHAFETQNCLNLSWLQIMYAALCQFSSWKILRPSSPNSQKGIIPFCILFSSVLYYRNEQPWRTESIEVFILNTTPNAFADEHSLKQRGGSDELK